MVCLGLLEGGWWGKLRLLRGRRSELLQLLWVNLLALRHYLRDLSNCLRVLQVRSLLLLRWRSPDLRLRLLLVLARVRLTLSQELLLLGIMSVLRRGSLRRLCLVL